MAELMSTLKVNENDYTIKDATAWSRIDDLYAIKESTSNKVTSMDSDSTDTQYPSAKCVYDAIQASTGAFEEITYNVTTKEQIAAIVDAGKIPYFIYNSILFIMTNYSASIFNFVSIYASDSVIQRGFTMFRSSGNWYSYTYNTAKTINTTTATDSYFPTCKAVKDYVDANAGVKLYRHNIKITYAAEPSDEIYVSILSISNVVMDAEAFMTYATSQFDRLYKIQASGTFHDTTSLIGFANGITVDSYPAAQGGTLTITGLTSTGQYIARSMYRTVDNFVITDTVVEVQ